jgi:hypothetical protein
MKLVILAAIAASLVGCAPQIAPRYAGYDGYVRHAHRVVYVDGRAYSERGVEYGDPPPGSIIPDEDPPVGTMTRPDSAPPAAPTPAPAQP